MSGELIGEFRSEVVGTRILELLENGPKIEATGKLTGKLLGIDALGLGTGWEMWLSADVPYGENVVVVSSKSGEIATFKASCVGKAKSGSLASYYSGAAYFHSSTPQWSRLNGMAVAFEYFADENGNYLWRFSELMEKVQG